MSEYNKRIRINSPSMDLTEREKDVLYQIVRNVKGKNYETLANNLCITKTTFQTHLNHIFQKTGTNSQLELIIKYYTGEINADNNANGIRKDS